MLLQIIEKAIVALQFFCRNDKFNLDKKVILFEKDLNLRAHKRFIVAKMDTLKTADCMGNKTLKAF